MGAGFNDIENKNNIEIKNISNSRLNGLSSWFAVTWEQEEAAFLEIDCNWFKLRRVDTNDSGSFYPL